jgi:hypothetical protein
LENTGYFDLKREEKEVSSLFLTSLKGYPLLGPFLCPSPLCLWGRFGVPYKGSAVIGAGCFWLRVWGFDLVLGITVVLVVIFGCMGSFYFIC